jgi:hypothetical protein
MSYRVDRNSCLQEIAGVLELIEGKHDPDLSYAKSRLVALRDTLEGVSYSSDCAEIENDLRGLLLENPRLDRAYLAWVSGEIVKQLLRATERFAELTKNRPLSPEELVRFQKAKEELHQFQEAHHNDVNAI